MLQILTAQVLLQSIYINSKKKDSVRCIDKEIWLENKRCCCQVWWCNPCNPSTGEARVGGLSIWGHPGPHMWWVQGQLSYIANLVSKTSQTTRQSVLKQTNNWTKKEKKKHCHGLFKLQRKCTCVCVCRKKLVKCKQWLFGGNWINKYIIF